MFFVTGYTGFAMDKMKPVADLAMIEKHLRHCATKGFPNLMAYEEQKDREVVIIGGGPSLNSDETYSKLCEFNRRKDSGDPISFVTVNGSYTWAKDHGFWPVTQFMLDPRAYNKRFIEPVDKDNKYIMAAQCHPEVWDALEAEKADAYVLQVNIHTHIIPVIEELWGNMYEDWNPIPGGSTVMLRVLPALQSMGFRKINIFGFDSCLMDDVHHAYEQKENDINGGTMEIDIEERQFHVHPWMLAQAKEFMDMKDTILRHLDIQVYGDGLIAWLIENQDAIEALPQE
jgi:hypothetical protein